MPKNNKMNSCCEMTMQGLNHWYVTEFEKLGWMILSQDKGLDDKISNYKMSIKLLKQSLEKKIKDIKDPDNKHDLELMLHNVELLIKHVNKDFSK